MRGMQYFFFFKQKTAYEMRISDWSSDVCSSDLQHRLEAQFDHALDQHLAVFGITAPAPFDAAFLLELRNGLIERGQHLRRRREAPQIGRASCRERVCQYV